MATRKFQKGDLVRCVNDDDVAPVLRRGALYALEEPRHERYVRTNDLNWLPERFELVRPVGGFQIGDRAEIGGWTLLVAKAEHIAHAEHNLRTVKFIERPEHHGFKVGDRVSGGGVRGRIGEVEGYGVGYVRVRWPGVSMTYHGDDIRSLFDARIAPAFQHLADWLKFRPGDIVEVVEAWSKKSALSVGDLHEVRKTINNGSVLVTSRYWQPKVVRLAGRPGADGWVAWFGGPNPVPGKLVEVFYASGKQSSTPAWPSERVMWSRVMALRGYKVVEEPGMTDSVASTPEEYGFFDFPITDALLRDKAYKAWLDEERDGRLRSAFEAGWKARGGK